MTGFTKMIVDGCGCVFPPLKGSEIWRYAAKSEEILYRKLEDDSYEKKEINQMLRILNNNNCLK
ncbi:MAG: hypothetical protein JSV92_05090 [archaeon]|nr:MAG: hypothetical protein JSV92_05090 [archaeon]